MFFNGTSSTKKVSIRGRSAAEESREAVLEKARLQREARQEKKRRDHAATVIQVRSWQPRRCSCVLEGGAGPHVVPQ
jgi:hypothetical protein